MTSDSIDLSPVLVTGGAGYIGSHVVLAMADAGLDAVVVDDLSTGHKRLVPDGVPLELGNAADQNFIRDTISKYGCRSVMHFAGSIIVPESVADPLAYYRNNTETSRSLLEASVAAGIESFVFSSTAAVYQADSIEPVDEGAPVNPANPYGRSKLMVEWMLADVAASAGLRYAALRYFNVAGADALGRSGQMSPESTHLIRVACQVATGARQKLTIFGDDYETPDGSCIRDFIHVSDLADAHLRALEAIQGRCDNLILNCGYGRGYSVKEVVAAVERVAGSPLAKEIGPRRPGDAMSLVADSSRLREVTGWAPRFDDLDVIVASALEWEQSLSVS